MIMPPRKFVIFLVVMTVTITMLALAGCGVSVESEPSEANAEGGCVSTYECSNRQVELLEEIKIELHEFREGR